MRFEWKGGGGAGREKKGRESSPSHASSLTKKKRISKTVLNTSLSYFDAAWARAREMRLHPDSTIAIQKEVGAGGLFCLVFGFLVFVWRRETESRQKKKVTHSFLLSPPPPGRASSFPQNQNFAHSSSTSTTASPPRLSSPLPSRPTPRAASRTTWSGSCPRATASSRRPTDPCVLFVSFSLARARALSCVISLSLCLSFSTALEKGKREGCIS